MTAFGEPALWLALILAAWAGVASIASILLGRPDLARSAARGVSAALASIAVAVAALAEALWARDFSFRYVATNTSLNLPDRYVVAALWAGPGGSLLVMALAVGACAAIAVTSARREPALVPWVTSILAGVLTVLLASVAFDVSPFAMLAAPVGDGRGLRAELQDSAFLVHPPLIALGVAASAVPFAFTVGSSRVDLQACKLEYSIVSPK